MDEQLELPLFTGSDPDQIYRIERVAEHVVNERWRQLEKWGIQSHEDGTSTSWQCSMKVAKQENQAAIEADSSTWAWILLEKVYEALCETDFTQNLRSDLVQCAAVLFAWIEDLDSRA